MEDALKTILGTDIPITARGILYGCKFDHKNLTIEVIGEIFFDSPFEALMAYSNIPNPESQMVSGKTFDEMIVELHALHKKMKDKKWLKSLANCL